MTEQITLNLQIQTETHLQLIKIAQSLDITLDELLDRMIEAFWIEQRVGMVGAGEKESGEGGRVE